MGLGFRHAARGRKRQIPNGGRAATSAGREALGTPEDSRVSIWDSRPMGLSNYL